MSKMRYFKCYPDDFLNGTAILNEEQFALYVRLFMFMYDQGGAVVFDTQQLKHVLHKRPQDIRRVVNQLVTMGKLRVDDGGLIHQGRTDEMTTKWRANGDEMKRHSSRNGAPKEEENAANTTRAPAHANARFPEARSHITNHGGYSSGSAREPESLAQLVRRRLAEEAEKQKGVNDEDRNQD